EWQPAFFDQIAEMVVDIVAAGDGAAGRIDSKNDGDDRIVVANAVDLLHRETVLSFHNRAADFNNGDFFRGELGQRVILLLRGIGRAEVAVITAVEPDDEHDGHDEGGDQPFAKPPERTGTLLNDDLLRWRIGDDFLSHGVNPSGNGMLAA